MSEKKKKSKKRSVDTPVIIAFWIVLVTILVLIVWKMFFDTSLKGSWHLAFKDDGKDYSYGLTFDNDNVVHYSFGGITYTGQYILDPENAVLNISSSSYGKYNINTDFQYQMAGNLFSGKELVLTNQGDVKLPFKTSSEYEPIVQKYDDFKADEAILGSWLYTDEERGYHYTFTFDENGQYEYLCSGSRHIGAYKTENGNFTYNLVADGGAVNEETLRYAFNNGKLTLITDTFADVLTKTDDKYSFETEIK